MIVEEIWDNVDASSQQISSPVVIGCGQDARILIQITRDNTDGDPKVFLEETVNDTIWSCVPNYLETDQGFPIDEDVVAIRDSYFMGKSIRLRLEPNGNTTGTISAMVAIKTKV